MKSYQVLRTDFKLSFRLMGKQFVDLFLEWLIFLLKSDKLLDKHVLLSVFIIVELGPQKNF